jgi:hypothetical protein
MDFTSARYSPAAAARLGDLRHNGARCVAAPLRSFGLAIYTQFDPIFRLSEVQ